MFNHQIKNYWRQKVQANLFSEGLDGSNPQRQIGGESFSRIFGGNTVDIRPQGAAELTFSGNIDKTKNPNLTQNQQSNGSFNFNQSIAKSIYFSQTFTFCRFDHHSSWYWPRHCRGMKTKIN